MLKINICNRFVKLIYDFELGPTDKPIITSSNNSMMKDNYLLSYCPNVVVCDDIIEITNRLDEFSYVALRSDLFKQFISAWLGKYVDIKVWYKDYVETIKDFSDKEYTELEPFNSYLRSELIKRLNTDIDKSTYNIDLIPEMSVCLQYYIQQHKYEDIIMEEVNRNIKEYKNLQYWSNAIQVSPFKNFTSTTDIIYITQPFSLDQVQTNHRYIRRLLCQK